MPKRSIYLKDEEDALYERVKELTEEAGDTIAGIFVDAMMAYVARKEKELRGLEEFTIFIGEQHVAYGNLGEYIKFVGRLFAKEQRDEGGQEKYGQSLYKTRKMKLLLVEENTDADGATSTYRIFESIRELANVKLLPKISKSLKDEEIGVRRLDI